MIHWGVENEFHTFLGQAQLGTMCTLFNGDYIVCSSKKTLFMSSNQISKTSSYVYTAVTFAEYLDMVFGVDAGFCRLSAFQPRNPTDFYLKDFPLGQQWVHQLHYDKAHNYLMTVGNDIKIWNISRNKNVSSPEERLVLELQSTIPSTSFICDLNNIFVDEGRSRIICPSSNGLIVYHYDGQIAANNPSMTLAKFNKVGLRIAPVKHERMKEKFPKEQNVIPLNLYKRFFACDNEGNLILWHRSGQILHKFEERIQSIIFAEFISAEFLILVDKMSKIYILDVKSYNTVLVDDSIKKNPDRVFLLRNPDRLSISSVNEIWIFKINTLWKLWYHPVSTAFSIHHFTSPHLLSRYGFFSDDGFFRLVSPKGSYLIASAAVKKCATPRCVAYDPNCHEDLCAMALDDSTIQFFKIVDPDSDIILNENDDKYDNREKTVQLLTRKVKKEETDESNKENENDQKTEEGNEDEKLQSEKSDENEAYEVNKDDLERRAQIYNDNDQIIKETDDFHIIDSIKSSSTIVLLAKVFDTKEWALISLGPSGDLNVFEWGTWEQKKRLFIDHSLPKFAFWDRSNNHLIIISQKKLLIISLETFIIKYNERFKEPQHACYENGFLIAYSKDGKAGYYEVSENAVKKVADLNIPDKVVALTLQYGIHIFVFDNCSITIGNRTNFSICSIQFPFQPTAVSFTNCTTLDLLIAIENEVMILPLSKYCSDIEASVVQIDDYDGDKTDPRVFIKKRNQKHHSNKKYQDAATGTNDYYSDSSDIGDYDDINSNSDDDEFTDDDEYNKKRRIKRYKKQLKKGIFKSREFKTTFKPNFDTDSEFDDDYEFYKRASLEFPEPRPIKKLTSSYEIPKESDKEKEPRKPVYVIAGKIKSGQKPSVYRFSKSKLNNEEEEIEEEEEEESNEDRIKGMFDLLEIKELTFDKETQTDETFVAKMKEREAEERRKQLLAKIAEMNKKNKRKGKDGKEGEDGEEGSDETETETDTEFDSEDSRYGGKGKKGKGKKNKKGKKGNGDDDYYTETTSAESKSTATSTAAQSRISSTSNLSSLPKNNGKNSRFNRKNRDKNGNGKGKPKGKGNDINSSLSNKNMPGDLYFDPSADAIGQQKNVVHPDGYGKGGRNGKGGKNGNNFGYGDGNGDFSTTPRRGRFGKGKGKGYGYGYGAGGENGDDSNNGLSVSDKFGGGLPSKIYRRIDYDDVGFFDRLNGHSPSCKCRECCDPNYKNLHKDVHLPSYRLIDNDGENTCGCGHDHKHAHQIQKNGRSYIYGNDPYIGITIENFPSDTEFKDTTILCGYDNPPLKDDTENHVEFMPIVPPKSPKKKKMPIVIPPDRLSFNNRKIIKPPAINTSVLSQAQSQQRPNSCRSNVLMTQQDGGDPFVDEIESSRPKSSRTILSTPEKEALWQTPETAYNDDSVHPQFRFSASARTNYPSNSFSSSESSPRIRQPQSTPSSARHSSRMTLNETFMDEWDISRAPRNLSRPVLQEEGYTCYGSGFGYEFAKNAPNDRYTSHSSSRRSNDILPPLPKVEQ